MISHREQGLEKVNSRHDDKTTTVNDNHSVLCDFWFIQFLVHENILHLPF